MKKFIIFLCLFCLWGCSNKSLKKSCEVVININSDVIPQITVSNGKGSFNKEKMQYILKTDNSSPVDISLSHDDYNSVNIYLSSKELMDGHVEKTVSFGEQKVAKVSLSIITNAPAWDIVASGIEFKRSLKTFTGSVKRTEEAKVSVSGGENYRNVNLLISPNDLITGSYCKDIILVKKAEAIIYLNSDISGLTILNYDTKERYKISQYDKGYYCVVKKGDYVLIDYQQKVSFYRINEDLTYENKTINNDILVKYNISSTYMKDIINPIQFLYYLKDNCLYYCKQDYQRNVITIPIGSQLFIIYPNNKGTYNIKYNYGYNPSKDIIYLTDDSFSNAEELQFDARFYDRITKEYITEINIDGKIQNANENCVFENITKFPEFDNYICQPFEVERLKLNNGKLEIDYEIALKDVNYVINFVDKNNNPLKIDLMNCDYNEISTGKYLIKQLKENDNGQLLFHEINGEFKLKVLTNNHWITIKQPLYHDLFESTKYNNEYTYELIEPIVMDKDSYSLQIWINNYFDYQSYYLTHNGKTYNSNNDLYEINNMKVNDIIYLFVYGNSQPFEIKCNKEMLDQGLLSLNRYGQVIPMQVYKLRISDLYMFDNHSYNVKVKDNYFIRFTSSKEAEVLFCGRELTITMNFQYKETKLRVTDQFFLNEYETIYYSKY